MFQVVQILDLLISLVSTFVVVQFVLSLLISFNVVNMHNAFVASVWTAVNALLDPMLNPIRRVLPNTGAIDFSPLVLLVGLRILSIIAWGLV